MAGVGVVIGAQHAYVAVFHRYKRGQIQESEVRRYEEFRRRLQAMAAAGGGGFENTEVWM